MLLIFLSVLASISITVDCEEEAMLSAVSVNTKYLHQLVVRQYKSGYSLLFN